MWQVEVPKDLVHGIHGVDGLSRELKLGNKFKVSKHLNTALCRDREPGSSFSVGEDDAVRLTCRHALQQSVEFLFGVVPVSLLDAC